MIILLLTLLFFFNCYLLNAAPPFGQLSVNGSKLLGSNSQQVQLAGMSLFWSNCGEGSIFYNAETLKALKCSWNANTVRAAMGVESTGCQRPGYLDVPLTERDKVEAVVKAAIQLDMYVVIDWHDNNAPNHLDKAIEFFTYFAQNYGKHPHILYETFNEPLQVDWSGVKAYHEKVVAAIRKYDTKNVIILGTTTWSQDVDIASSNPVNGANLCYTLHYYAASHKQNIRNKAQTALNNNACIFVTEYGTVYDSGGGNPDEASTKEWWSFLDNNKISYLNWALDNKAEGSAALNQGTGVFQLGDDSCLSSSGRLVKAKLKSMNNGCNCNGGSPSVPAPPSIPAPPVISYNPGNNAYKPPSNLPKNKPYNPPNIPVKNKPNNPQNNQPNKPANKPINKKPKNNNINVPNIPSPYIGPNNPGNNGVNTGSKNSIDAGIQLNNSWNSGANFKLVFKNNGNTKASAVKFTLILASGQSINSSWNFKKLSDNNYVLEDYATIQPGQKYTDAGFIVNGPATLPRVKLIGYN